MIESDVDFIKLFAVRFLNQSECHTRSIFRETVSGNLLKGSPVGSRLITVAFCLDPNAGLYRYLVSMHPIPDTELSPLLESMQGEMHLAGAYTCTQPTLQKMLTEYLRFLEAPIVKGKNNRLCIPLTRWQRSDPTERPTLEIVYPGFFYSTNTDPQGNPHPRRPLHLTFPEVDACTLSDLQFGHDFYTQIQERSIAQYRCNFYIHPQYQHWLKDPEDPPLRANSLQFARTNKLPAYSLTESDGVTIQLG